MDNFPIAYSFLKKMYLKNDKLQALLQQFEEALDANQKVHQKLKAIKPELQALKFQTALCDRVSSVSLERQKMEELASEAAENCYKQIVHMEQLIKQVEIGNILNYTVKCKEDETIREINLLKKSLDEEAKQLDDLESRSSVKSLRQLHIQLGRSERGLALLERETCSLERQMLNRMEKATDIRNRKIIHILKTRKLIIQLESSDGPGGSQSRLDSQRQNRPLMPPPKGPILVPALDFLNQFMQFQTNDNGKRPAAAAAAERESESEQVMALPSILHQRNGAPSPAKQVRFVDWPDLESVHIVNRLSSLSTDDGSVGREDLEPNSPGNASKKSSQMAGENWKDDGQEAEAKETEEMQFLSDDKDDDELTLMESEEEESSGDEKSGSTQAQKLPQEQESEKENENESSASSDEVNVKESQEKESVDVLSVVIIPPTAATFTPENSCSKYSRFKLTASQRTTSEAMDLDENEAEQKALDEDESNIEFPMAQPKPSQFKQPAAEAVSPPSSDQADSMLNFSEPNFELNDDDFWLNNNTDNNNLNDDQFYNL